MKTKQICKGDNNIQVSGNIIIGNGTEIRNSKIDSNSSIINNTIYLNGKQIPAPPKTKSNSKCVEIVNNHIWVSGWYWNGQQWIRMSKLRFKLMRKN